MPQAKHHDSNAALSHVALALTSDVLRHDNPSLAGAIEKALDSLTQVPSARTSTSRLEHVPLNTAVVTRLEAQTIGKILAALTDLGNRALADRERYPEQLELVHELLEDWVELADWLLRCADTYSDSSH